MLFIPSLLLVSLLSLRLSEAQQGVDDVCHPCGPWSSAPGDVNSYSTESLNKPLQLPGISFPGLSCGTLETALPLLLTADSEECEIVQRLAGEYCGCPTVPSFCGGLCHSNENGKKFNESASVINFSRDETSGDAFDVSCQLVHSYLQSFEQCTLAPADVNGNIANEDILTAETILAEWDQMCSCGLDEDSAGDEGDVNSTPDSPLTSGCPLCPLGDEVGFPDKDLRPFLEQALTLETEFSEDLVAFENVTVITCSAVDALLKAAAVPSLCGTDEYLHLAGMCGCPPVENSCNLCPTNDIAHPLNPFLNIGFRSGFVTTCEQVNLGVKLFSKSSQYCWTAREAAFQCGCNGGTKWYLGASTEIRHAFLAWVPRVSGFLSLLGSLYILQDLWRARKRRRLQAYHWLVLGMSLFDVSSSFAWMFSTAPIPESDADRGPSGIYGAHGNSTTCKAQGFLLELGFVGSTAFNASLTIFYVLSIVYNYGELKTKPLLKYLVGFPTLLAVALAAGGIPFYDYLNVICYFPNPFQQEAVVGVWRYFIIFAVVPICTATLVSVVNLAIICYSVWKKSTAADRWRFGSVVNTTARASVLANSTTTGNSTAASDASRRRRSSLAFLRRSSTVEETRGQRRKLSRTETIVFWQAFFYVMAFLLTWVVYLVGMFRPYLSTNDDELFAFWIVLLALNPLMGFWNAIVYIKPWAKTRNTSRNWQSPWCTKRMICCRKADATTQRDGESDEPCSAGAATFPSGSKSTSTSSRPSMTTATLDPTDRDDSNRPRSMPAVSEDEEGQIMDARIQSES